MRIQMYGQTDIGRVRKGNQDGFHFDAKHGIAIVADGIGGRKGGDIASGIAVAGLRKAYLECDSLRHEEVAPFLVASVDLVNKQLFARGRETPEVQGLGTTVNCLLFVGEKLYIAHLGDSRTYLYSRGNLWQLTLDHSVEVYVGRGWLPLEAVSAAAKPTALVRALGLSEQCEVDVYEKNIKAGEIFLTCSDGLTGMVNDKKICAIIKEHERRPADLPQALINEANRKGGRDNITVVISEVLAS